MTRHKLKVFSTERSIYYHHRYGTLGRKRTFKLLVINSILLLVSVGGFFIVSDFALPAARDLASNFQATHDINVNPVALAESETDNKLSNVPDHEDEALKNLVQQKLAAYPKDERWSVFSYDLNTGSSVNINANDVFASGGLYKLFLLQALENKLPFDKWDYSWLPDGTNVQDCVNNMLGSSDSACGETLAGYLDWDYINRLDYKIGFKNTKITDNEGRETTSGDLGKLLIELEKGQILSNSARRFVFDTLYQQIRANGITAGCVNTCRTADKIGLMQTVANDAGVVTHGGHSYVLVVLSEGGSLKQITEITKVIETSLSP